MPDHRNHIMLLAGLLHLRTDSSTAWVYFRCYRLLRRLCLQCPCSPQWHCDHADKGLIKHRPCTVMFCKNSDTWTVECQKQLEGKGACQWVAFISCSERCSIMIIPCSLCWSCERCYICTNFLEKCPVWLVDQFMLLKAWSQWGMEWCYKIKGDMWQIWWLSDSWQACLLGYSFTLLHLVPAQLVLEMVGGLLANWQKVGWVGGWIAGLEGFQEQFCIGRFCHRCYKEHRKA